MRAGALVSAFRSQPRWIEDKNLLNISSHFATFWPSRMETVRSKEGTNIAYAAAGSGPPLVLVHIGNFKISSCCVNPNQSRAAMSWGGSVHR